MSPASPDAQRYSPRLGVGVAQLSFALLMTEIVLTRIFSVVIWYHFAFLAISVALFGTAVAAVAVHMAQARLARMPLALPIAAALLSVSVVVADLVLVRVVPRWFGLGNPEVHLTFRLLLMFLVTAAPFFFAGAAIGLSLLRGAGSVHRLYFWDLLGAGAGCVGVIGLLQWLGGPQALLACAGMGTVAALTLGSSLDVGLGMRRHLPGVLSAFVVLGVAWAHGQAGLLEIRYAKGRDLQLQPPEFSRWNSHSLVTVLKEEQFAGWGMSPTYRGALPDRKSVIIDMNALTVMTRFDGDLGAVRHLHADLSGFVYQVEPHPQTVCVLGAGGGRDVLAALAAGARHVTGVEINPLIVNDVMRGAYREFTGDLYGRPDVQIVVDDGRSYLRATDDRFDVLLVSMVDTSAATAAGAYALTENNLYTVEAFEDFMDRLAPGGVVSVSSVSLPGLAVGARLVSLAAAALRARGIDPAASVAVIEQAWLGLPGAVMHNVIIKPDGLSPQEIASAAAGAARLQFTARYLPGQPAESTPGQTGLGFILHAKPEALSRWYARLPLDVSPVHDDRPFFFYQDRLRDFATALWASGAAHPFGNGLVFLAKLLLVSVVMVALCLLLPLLLRARDAGRPTAHELALAACLGLGFMLLELGLVQRLTGFVGNPTHTLAAVLGVLLVAGGVGSRLSERLPLRGQALPLAIAAICAVGLLLAIGMPPLLRAAQAGAASLRALLAAGLMAPLGLLLGMPLPSLLRRAAATDPRRLPWLWGVNGATSVLGSVLATFISLHAGITVTLVTGAVVYALAGVLWVAGRGRVPA